MSGLLTALSLVVSAFSTCTCKNVCGPTMWSVTELKICYPCSKAVPHAVECTCILCVINIDGFVVPTKCEDGYYPAGNTSKLCANCPSACTICVNANVCTGCIPGFHLTNSLCIMDNCNTMTGLLTCGECNAGYYLTDNKGRCSKCIEPCVNCADENTCTSCISGYELSSSGVCHLPNCKVMSGKVCTECDPGFYVTSNQLQCLPCTSLCTTCSGAPDSCTSCDSPYVLVSSRCIVPHCTTMNGDKCSACETGYYLVPGGLECRACSSPCKTCRVSATVCESCIAGFTQQGDQCIIPNCDRVADGKCVECAPGFYLTEDRMACPTCSANCVTCTGSAAACTSCKKGLVLNNVAHTCVVPNCASMDGDRCRECNAGYYASPDGSQCLLCETPCKKCRGSATTCTECEPGYELTEGACRILQCNIMNGLTCTECNVGYYLENPKLCSACELPCAACSTGPSNCTACPPDHTLTEHRCIIDGCAVMSGVLCTTCVDGRFLADGGAKCLLCASQCATCTGTATHCTSCGSGLMLNTTTHTCTVPNCKHMEGNICKDCNPGFYPANDGNKCLPCTPPCTTCLGGPTVCTACNTSYILSGSECVVPNCGAMNGAECTTCLSGYYIVTSLQCSKCESSCAECSTSASHCTACPHGYEVDSGKCVVNNCAAMDGVACRLCKDGYFLADSRVQCLPCTAPCAACSGPATACTSCREGFNLDAATHACVLPNCLAMHGTRCTKCDSMYYLQADGAGCDACDAVCAECAGAASTCTACNTSYSHIAASCVVPNCDTMGGAACTACSAGFWLSSPLSCLPCTAPCAECSASATSCTACVKGYDLDGNTCKIANCKVMNGVKCKECSGGYYPSASGMECLACSPRCEVCTNPSSCSACAEGSKFGPGSQVCYKDGCSPCKNGKCEAFDAEKAYVCACASGLVLFNSTCVLNICGFCFGGECKISANYTRYCDCGDGKGLYAGNCIPSTCKGCNNGFCLLNSDASSLYCSCSIGYILDKNGDCIIVKTQQTNHRYGVIIGPIIGIALGVVIGVIVWVLVRRHQRRLRIEFAKMVGRRMKKLKAEAKLTTKQTQPVPSAKSPPAMWSAPVRSPPVRSPQVRSPPLGATPAVTPPVRYGARP